MCSICFEDVDTSVVKLAGVKDCKGSVFQLWSIPIVITKKRSVLTCYKHFCWKLHIKLLLLEILLIFIACSNLTFIPKTISQWHAHYGIAHFLCIPSTYCRDSQSLLLQDHLLICTLTLHSEHLLHWFIIAVIVTLWQFVVLFTQCYKPICMVSKLLGYTLACMYDLF